MNGRKTKKKRNRTIAKTERSNRCILLSYHIYTYLTNFFNFSPSPTTKVPFTSSSKRPTSRFSLRIDFWLFGFLIFYLSFSLSSLLNGQTHLIVRKRFLGDCVLTMKPSEALLLATCPENQGVKAVISVTVMFFLATIVVAIRFYVRLVMLHGATGWDDYFILGSLVSFFIFYIYFFIFSGSRFDGEADREGGKRSGPTPRLWLDLNN